MIKLIALDFDLTIYDYRRPADTLHLRSWFERLSSQGVLVGTASGRTFESLRHEITAIGMEWGKPFPSFAIVEEGVILSPDGEPWPGLDQRNRDRALVIDDMNARLLPHFESAANWATANQISIERAISTGPFGINVVFDTPANAERVRQQLLTQVPRDWNCRISRNHHIGLGLPIGSEKGQAVSDLVRRLNLSNHEALVVGDNLNDLCMLDSHHGFRTATVGNAVPEVRNAIAVNGGVQAEGHIAFGVAEIFAAHFGDPSVLPIPMMR